MLPIPDYKAQTAPRVTRLLKKRDQTKTADTDASTAGTDDPDFFFPTVAGKVYTFIGRLFYTTGATEDFKFLFAVNGAAATIGTANLQGCMRSVRAPGSSLAETEGAGNQFATNGTVSVNGGTGTGSIFVVGWFQARQSGNVFLRWAQNTSGATPTILRAGSYIEITEVDAQARRGEVESDPWQCVCKMLTETRASDGAVLAKDAELRATLQANRRYAFKATIAYTTGTTPDFKIAVNGPASPVFFAAEVRGVGPAAAYSSAQITSFGSATAFTAASGTGGGVEIWGIVELSQSGDLEIQWAQNTSNAAATAVLAGSTLEILPLP